MSKKTLQGLAISPSVAWLARIALCALALGIAACAGSGQRPVEAGTDFATAAASPTPAAAQAPGGTANPTLAAKGLAQDLQTYRIGPDDLLKIEVFGVEAMGRSVRVNSGGEIVLPMIGAVHAGGLTSDELAAAITARLAKDYLQNPQVLIFIEEYTSQRVTVVGAVTNSGVYPLKGRSTLLQAIASAGGPTNVANRKSVKIIRTAPDGTRKITEYNLYDINEGRIPDPEIRGQDLVLVDTSLFKDTVKQTVEFIFPFMVFGALL